MFQVSSTTEIVQFSYKRCQIVEIIRMHVLKVAWIGKDRQGNLPDSSWPKEVRSACRLTMFDHVWPCLTWPSDIFHDFWVWETWETSSKSNLRYGFSCRLIYCFWTRHEPQPMSSIVFNLDWTLSQNLTIDLRNLTAQGVFRRFGFSCANRCIFNMTIFWEIPGFTTCNARGRCVLCASAAQRCFARWD